MSNKNAEIEQNTEKQIADKKPMNFFKRVYYAIFKVDKYSEFLEENQTVAFVYMFELIAVLVLIAGLCCFAFPDNNKLLESLAEVDISVDIDFIFTIFYLLLLFLNAVYCVLFVLLLYWFAKVVVKFIDLSLKEESIMNIAVYSYTVSAIIMNVRVVLNTFTDNNLDALNLVYFVIPYIYVMAALLIIKQNIIKPDMIVQVERRVTVEDLRRKEEEEEKESEEDLKRREEQKKEEQKKKRERKRRLKPKDPLEDTEPDGSEI